MTEALIVKDDEILLGRRKKNGFGQGKWLGLAVRSKMVKRSKKQWNENFMKRRELRYWIMKSVEF